MYLYWDDITESMAITNIDVLQWVHVHVQVYQTPVWKIYKLYVTSQIIYVCVINVFTNIYLAQYLSQQPVV